MSNPQTTRYGRKYGLSLPMVNYLNAPLPDISSIFPHIMTYPEKGVDSPVVDVPIEDVTEDQILQAIAAQDYYNQINQGGGGNDDTGNVDTTNNAGITGLPGLLTAASFVVNPVGTILGYGLKKGYENYRDKDVEDKNIDITDLGSITGDARVAEDTQNIGRQDMIDTMDSISGVTTGDASVAEAVAAQAAAAQAAANRDRARGLQTGDGDGPSDTADDFDDGTMTGKAATSTGKTAIDSFFDAVDKTATKGGGATSGPSGTMSDAQAEANRDAARGGQSGGDSGGKIVCTMMNESYGFGSFRNKIWLKHSKSLAPEYQKGYHKIFLPLVKYAKQDGVTNKIVKKILEHIAVHRTIDIRQESRNKIHLLGRIYRKVLEPICYLVGKHG